MKSLLKGISIDDLDEYLARSEIISIPASITASANLVIIMTCALSAFHLNPDLKEELKSDLKESGIENALQKNNIVGLKQFFDANEKRNGLLHRIFLESLRRESLLKTPDHLTLETIQTRFTSKPIEIEDHGTIPAHSTIMFLPGSVRFNSFLWDKPEEFDPKRFETNTGLSKYSLSIFSQGSRQCPAKLISSYLFKSMLSYLTLFCDLKLELGYEARLDKIGVECVPTNSEENLQSSYFI